MKEAPAHTPYHPRWYRSRVSTYWWLGKWAHLKFILREISSVFVAFFVVLLLLQIWALERGPRAYAEFQRWLESPLLVALSLLSFFFVVFHAITWFSLAPRAMVVRLRGTRLPDAVIAGSNYLAWLIVSLIIGWALLGG